MAQEGKAGQPKTARLISRHGPGSPASQDQRGHLRRSWEGQGQEAFHGGGVLRRIPGSTALAWEWDTDFPLFPSLCPHMFQLLPRAHHMCVTLSSFFLDMEQWAKVPFLSKGTEQAALGRPFGF